MPISSRNNRLRWMWNKTPTLLSLILAATLSSGCAEMMGSLNVDSGSPISGASTGFGKKQPVFAVHRGERAMITFVCKFGSGDYAIMCDEAGKQYSDCGPALKGKFQWLHTFDRASADSLPSRFTVTAYRRNGLRDKMPVGGKLVDGSTMTDEADERVAEATVLVRVYQSALDVNVKLPDGEPDWALSRLEIKPTHRRVRRIRQDRQGRRGFEVSGPDSAGTWHVHYEPSAGEVNVTGTTPAELTVADERGQTAVFRQSIETP